MSTNYPANRIQGTIEVAVSINCVWFGDTSTIQRFEFLSGVLKKVKVEASAATHDATE